MVQFIKRYIFKRKPETLIVARYKRVAINVKTF